MPNISYKHQCNHDLQEIRRVTRWVSIMRCTKCGRTCIATFGKGL